MKLRKKVKSLLRASVAMLLVCSLLLTIAGCGNSGQQAAVTKLDTDTPTTFVDWDESGEYTAVLSGEDEDLSDVTAADVEIAPCVFYEVSQADIAKGISAAGDGASAFCTVTNTRYEDGMLQITFRDANASSRQTEAYAVRIQKKNIVDTVYVNFPVITAAADISYVFAGDDSTAVTLTLDNGEFASKVTAEDLTLSGSFSSMQPKDIKTDGSQLTMTLQGSAEIPEGQDVYTDGVIVIHQSAIQNGHEAVSVRIPVQENLIAFASGEMTVDGSTVTVPLTVMGKVDAADLHTGNIVFGDTAAGADETQDRPAVKVTKVEQKSDTQALVTMEVEGVSDKNSAAKALDGRTVTVGGSSAVASFAPAGFYPLFDYIEKNGDQFRMTLEIDAQNGAFAENVGADAFTLTGDLSEATNLSVSRKSDTQLMLQYDLPANGQPVDDFSYNGTITLAAGSLHNIWGDPTDQPVEYSRSFSQDTLGRSTANLIMLTRVLGISSNVLTAVGVAFSVVTTILQMSGAVKSAAAQVMDINKEINKNLDYLFDQFKSFRNEIDEISDQVEWRRVEDFNVQLAMLVTYCQKFAWYMSKENQAMLGCEPVELTGKEKGAELAEKYRKLKVVFQKISQAEDSSDPKIALRFRDYFATYNTMREYYMNVCALLEQEGDNNPVNTYIHFMSKRNNFDTQTFEARNAYLDAISTALLLGSTYINFANLSSTTINDDGTLKLKTVAKAANNELLKVSTQLQTLMDSMEKRIAKKTKTTVYYKSPYCYTFGVAVDKLDTQNGNVFWANTWRESDPTTITWENVGDMDRLLGQGVKNQKDWVTWLKGPAVFVYSLHDDYKSVIEKSKKAPYYIADNFTWGDGFFSAKAPEGLPAKAIAEPLSEDMFRSNAEKFVQLMRGRTLEQELQSAGLQYEKGNTKGLPISSQVKYICNDEDDEGWALRAETYMYVLPWDKPVTMEKGQENTLKATLTATRMSSWDSAGVYRHWCTTKGSTMDWDAIMKKAITNRKSRPVAKIPYGNQNVVNYARWVIQTPGEKGTSPSPDLRMTYKETDKTKTTAAAS